MALTKRIYINDETVITAENLNAIQDAIIEAQTKLDDCATTDYVDGKVPTAITNDKIDEICGSSVNTMSGVKF